MQHAREDRQDGTDPHTGIYAVELHQLLPLTPLPQDIRSERASIANVSDQSVLESIAKGEIASGPPATTVLTTRRPSMDAFCATIVLYHDTCWVFYNDYTCYIPVVLALP